MLIQLIKKMADFTYIAYIYRHQLYRPSLGPGDITWSPVSGGYKYGDLALQSGRASNLKRLKYGHESCGIETENGCVARTSKKKNKLRGP
jgi:hypothetical protein